MVSRFRGVSSMSYPNQPQNDGDVDIIWEWPEDDWVSLGEHCDMNMWIRHNGELWINIYAVRDGKTDTRQALCTYRVEVFDNGK